MQTVDFERVGLNAGDLVLDLGCGEGRHVISAYFTDGVQSVGVDLCHADLLTTREKFSELCQAEQAQIPSNSRFLLAQSNALKLPFADHCFDKVICSEVLEHIDDYESVIVEIERVLKPGGEFVASVPRFWPEWLCWALSDEYHANEGGHLRIFKAADLRSRIERAGFRFFSRHWAHALHSPYWWLQCLFWNNKENSVLVRAYQRFLEWDIIDKPWLTRALETVLNPVMGKSVVLYFRKGDTG